MRKTFLPVLLVCASIGAARADDCKPLRYYTAVPIVMKDGALTVPATLNDKPVMLLFDTGGIANQVTRQTVQSLDLRERESPLHLLDISGNPSRTLVRVDKFAMGIFKVEQMQFQVMANPNLEAKNIAGLLSNDFLNAFDIDLDFASGRMNFFMTDHCPGKTVYWPNDALAAVPITVNYQTHIVVPVTVDGHTLKAEIDTGAGQTFMNMDVARSLFDLSPDSPDMTAMESRPNSDTSTKAYRHSFSSLSFEGITVKNASVIIIPDQVNSKVARLTPGQHTLSKDVTLPDLIIGMNILQKLHVYISYKERMLYLTPPGDQAGKMLPPLAAAPDARP